MGNKEINRYDPYDIQTHTWGKYFQQNLDVSEVRIRIEIKNDDHCYWIFSQRDQGPTLVKGPCGGTGSMNIRKFSELEENKDNLGKVRVIIRDKLFEFENIKSFWDVVGK